MLEFIENIGSVPDCAVSETLSLDYAQRGKARQRVLLDSGREAGLFLERSKVLFEGDILRTAEGSTVRVICKAEPVVTAMADDWLYFARACYHFGNRHVPLQIGEKWLRFSPDPVLEKMAVHFGLEIRKECMPFAPESGAYHSHGRDAGDSPASC